MLMSTPRSDSGEHSSPEALLGELHAAGPVALAELLGDVNFLLTAVATSPKKMFESRTRSRGEYKKLLDAVHISRSALDALEARSVVAFAEATRRDHLDAVREQAAHEEDFLPPLERLIRQADGRAARDYSLLTRRSPSAADASLASARRLVGSMPRMLTALAEGQVTSPVAYATATSAAPLDDLQRRHVDEMLHERMPQLDGAGVKTWRRATGQAIGELDPDGAAHRHTKARRTRHVTLTPGEHGMATLSAHLPALDAKLAHKRLSLEAERQRADGASEGHGALMADALTDTLLGRDGGMEPVTLDLGVMITDRALLSPRHGDPAQIEGYGPVPAEALREELRNALADPVDPERDTYGPDGAQVRVVMRRLYTHPTPAELVAVESRAREFPPALRRFLVWRDGGICRAPHCDAPIRQADHIHPASQGGPTSVQNGQGLCARCNQGKEEDSVRVELLEDPERPGHLVAWTGYGGSTVIAAPPAMGPTTSCAVGADPPGDEDSDPDSGPEPTLTGSSASATGAAESLACRRTVELVVRIPEEEQGDAVVHRPQRVSDRPRLAAFARPPHPARRGTGPAGRGTPV